MPIRVPGSDYTSSVGVPGSGNFEQASGTALGAADIAAAKGFNQLEQTGLLAQRQMSVIEFEKAKQRQNDAVLSGTGDALEKLNAAENEIRFGATEPDGTVTVSPATSSDYLARWHDAANTIRQDAISNVVDPDTSQALARALTHAFILRSHTAESFATNLFVNEQDAEANTRADQALRIYSSEPDPLIAAQAVGGFKTWLNDKAGVFGPLDVQKRMKKFSEDVAEADANSEIKVGSYNRDNYTSKLNPAKLDILDNRAEAVRHSRVVESEKRQTANDKEAEAERQRLLVGIDQQIQAGNYTLADLNKDVEQRVVAHPMEYERIKNLIINPKPEKSDAATWRDVSGDVWSPKPTYTPQRIRDLMSQGRLSTENGRQAVAELTRKMEHAQELEHARAKEEYTNVKQEGFRALGITTPFSQLDKKEAKIVSDYEQQLNAESFPVNPKGLPAREVQAKLLPIYLDRASSETKQSYGDQSAIVSKLFGSQPPGVERPSHEFYDWYKQQQEQVEKLRSSNPNLYNRQKEQLQRLFDSWQSAYGAAIRQQAGPKAPTGGYLPKELR